MSYLNLIQEIVEINMWFAITLEFFQNNSYELTLSEFNKKKYIRIKNLKSYKKEMWGVAIIDMDQEYKSGDEFDDWNDHIFDDYAKLVEFLKIYLPEQKL